MRKEIDLESRKLLGLWLAVDLSYGASVTTPKPRKFCFSRPRDQPQAPAGTTACPHASITHQKAECAWPWTGGQVMAHLCNHTKTMEILFFSRQRDQPQTPAGPAACPRTSTGSMCVAVDPSFRDGATLQPHRNEGNFVFLKMKGSAPNSSRPWGLSTFMSWLNVLGGGPVV